MNDPAEREAFEFSRLIEPVGAEAFFAEYWEERPLLLQQRGASHYDSLLSIEDLEEFISQADARYPAIRLAKGGAYFPPEAYTRDVRYGDEIFRGVPDVERIFSEYSSGASVTLPALHRSWPPLNRLCMQMEAELDHSVHTNAYLTPAGVAGFTPHYDTHEVFVLQIAGRTHWKVYPPPLPLPHRSQVFSPERYTLPAQPLMQCQLEAGDLLYLPRGYVHTTTTAEHFSAHLTIGVTVYTWVELLSELLQGAIGQVEFRRALPPGFVHRSERHLAIGERFKQLFDALARNMDTEALTDGFVRRIRAGQPRRSARFQAQTERIGPRTPLRIAPGRDYRVMTEGAELILEIDGRRVRLQSAVAPALTAICQANDFTPDSLPDAISLDARLALVRFLEGLGFLQCL